MNIMIFDSSIVGHHSEYIGHLVKYLVGKKDDVNYSFVVHPDFSIRLPDIMLLSKNNTFLNITCISPHENSSLNTKNNIVLRSLSQYKIMNAYAIRLHASHVILLDFNVFQFALILFKPRYTVSGILFKPFPLQEFSNSIVGKLHKKRKEIQTKWMVKNKRIQKIFLLNDKISCAYLNKNFNTTIFKYLPDPIPLFEAEKDFEIRSTYSISKDKTIYLLVGSLEDRKGTLETIRSLQYLNKEVQQKICVLIIGKAIPAVDFAIKALINEDKTRSVTQLVYENEYISTGKLKGLLEQTDFILMPYKSAEASSGILGHAILNRKMVIGPKNGLLGSQIIEIKIGFLLEKIGEEEISKAIEQSFYSSIRKYEEKDIRDNYLNMHTDFQFAKIVTDN